MKKSVRVGLTWEEHGVINAALACDRFFKKMIKDKVFSIEDMSDPEIELMKAVKEWKKNG